ncbi:MAG: hypothetical protein KBG75_03885 [Pseudomonadales bacterium]|nr:hypothetical protein [Pseudomonadales bacterium]
MKHPLPGTTIAETQIAHFAIAQFLLFEATVESLAALTETVSRLRQPGEPVDSTQLTEPFRVRYALFRRMLDQERLH